MVQTCTAEQLPLMKILLHAAKYPQASVNGLLLGTASPSVTVTDAIPLFHNSIGLAAPTEIALTQIEAYTKQPGRPQIVGYYHSDARFQSADMGPVSRRLADKLAEKYPHALVVLLDNKKLATFVAGADDAAASASTSGGHPFEIFSHEAGTKGWKREPQEQLSVSGGASSVKSMRETFLSLFHQQAQRGLSDFDDHLDDISKDYLNPELSSMGKLALPGQMR